MTPILNDMLFTLGGAIISSLGWWFVARRYDRVIGDLRDANSRAADRMNSLRADRHHAMQLLERLTDRNTDYRQALKTIDDLKAEIARRTPAKCGGKFVSKRAA